MVNKILVLVGGGIGKHALFAEEAKKLEVDLKVSSFSRLEYLLSSGNPVEVKIDDVPLEYFDLIYIRLIGKRKEDVGIVVNYAKDKGIKIVDEIYKDTRTFAVPLPKSIEAKLFFEAGINVPKTYFARLKKIKEEGPRIFGYPFVIKGTAGKQGRAVWSPKSEKELGDLFLELRKEEKRGERFIAQEFVKASQRSRVLVVGDRAIAAITRPTRWRKRFVDRVNGSFPEAKRMALNPIPEDQAEVAIKAAKALRLNIAGVDVLKEDKTGKIFILEANQAPKWDSIKEDTDINVEREVIKYLAEY